MRLIWVTAGVVVAVLTTAAVWYYVTWQRGNDLRIPGVGVVRRFPCSDYDVPRVAYDTIQAFAVIDSAALAARSNEREAVRTLVDAVFDRELPNIRCGNPLRHRVSEAEWRFRNGDMPAITEQKLADVANEILMAARMPLWARTSVEELHFVRTALREVLPRFVGTVESELQLSAKMSPIESTFVLMTLGRGMILEPEDFRNGPEGYLVRARERQLTSPPSGAVLRVRITAGPTLDIANGDGFDEGMSALTSAQRLLDRLDFPK
jgi:hypothetical protein